MKSRICFSIPYTVLLSFLFTIFTEDAHSLLLDWEKSYGGTDDDRGYSLCRTSDGGFIITGYTNSFENESYVLYLIKTDAKGDTQWTRTFTDKGDDVGYSVKQTPDGGYIVVGETGKYPKMDILLLKTDPKGELLWKKRFGGPDDDSGYSVCVTNDGGIILVGKKYYDETEHNVYAVRTDKDGNIVWKTCYGGEEIDEGRAVKQTSDSGFIIVGKTQSFSETSDVIVIRTDSCGDTLWMRAFGGENLEIGTDVIETEEGDFVVTGYSCSPETWVADAYVIKIDSQGKLVWEKTIGSEGDERTYAIVETEDKGFLIAGYTQFEHDAGGDEVQLLKIDSEGNPLWTREYGGDAKDHGRSLVLTEEGEIVIVGFSRSYPISRGEFDVYLIKIK
jgi:hypothetical protein